MRVGRGSRPGTSGAALPESSAACPDAQAPSGRDVLRSPPPPPPEPSLEIRRSSRRQRTASARREGDRIVVLLPEGLPPSEEQRLVTQLLARIQRGEGPQDDDLMSRATALSERYLGGHARPQSVQWVDTMERRWGSCTPSRSSIRLSRRAAGFPDYVIDYLLLHELTHLLVAGHGPDFWTLLRSYPKLERARGFLDGADRGLAP